MGRFYNGWVAVPHMLDIVHPVQVLSALIIIKILPGPANNVQRFLVGNTKRRR
jgi:hypothetical protein